MEAVFFKILNMSICAGWLILAVLLLRMMMGKGLKSFRCLLWAFVAVRLSCPFSFKSTFSLIPSAETVSPAILYSQNPTVHSGIPALNHAVNPLLSHSFTPQLGASVNPLQVWAFIASLLWISGMAVIFLYAALGYLRLKKLTSPSIPFKDNLWLCDSVETPFLFGIFKPKIYLPSNIPENTINYVAAHEYAHLKRYDHLWKLLGFCLLAVHWFNPLVWIAYHLFCQDIELACDEQAIFQMDMDEKRAYSEALLSFSLPRCKLPACPLAFGETSIKTRVRSVLQYQKPALRGTLFAAAICILSAACFLTNPVGKGLSSPFDASYSVTEIVYGAPQYSYSFSSLEDAPQYHLTADNLLYQTAIPPLSPEEIASDQWNLCGPAAETQLTKENFDRYFENNGPVGFHEGFSAENFRRNNHKAWLVIHAADTIPQFYYLLQQKDGSFYLTYGYCSAENGLDENSNIRWMFRLSKNDPSVEEAFNLLNTLTESISYENEKISFTIPKNYLYPENWNISIFGRTAMEDVGMSVHLFEQENQQKNWEPGKTYQIDLAGTHYLALNMEVSLFDNPEVSRRIDLLAFAEEKPYLHFYF